MFTNLPHETGLRAALCNTTPASLAKRPQTVGIGGHTSSPRGCVLSPRPFTLNSHGCDPGHGDDSAVWFVDASSGSEDSYQEENEWCAENNLLLSITKIKTLPPSAWLVHLKGQSTLSEPGMKLSLTPGRTSFTLISMWRARRGSSARVSRSFSTYYRQTA